jgi:hypothetical protein
VQLQVVIAAAKLDSVDTIATIVDCLAHCGDDILIPQIGWANLHGLLETESTQFLTEVKKHDLKKSPGLAKIMPRVTERILAARKK